MQTMSLKEARSHLSSLVDQAERGGTAAITRHGRRVACIGPAPAGRRRLPSLKAFRAQLTVPVPSLSETVTRARREERD